jgi:hypothetical protein
LEFRRSGGLARWREQHPGQAVPFNHLFPEPDISQERGDQAQPNSSLTYIARELGLPWQGVGAFERGMGNILTLGLDQEIGAGTNALLNGGGFDNALAQQEAVDRYDNENHFIPRLGGQLVGGVMQPFPASGLGRQTATAAA